MYELKSGIEPSIAFSGKKNPVQFRRDIFDHVVLLCDLVHGHFILGLLLMKIPKMWLACLKVRAVCTRCSDTPANYASVCLGQLYRAHKDLVGLYVEQICAACSFCSPQVGVLCEQGTGQRCLAACLPHLRYHKRDCLYCSCESILTTLVVSYRMQE
ncbi:hypothetical protein IF2G_06632 [Cordyceps javanica]|nr:hypothetical protein IF2G_06632 [Cordyceps javanica]